MKILAFTDVHGMERNFREIEKKSISADICVCCGDFSVFENHLNLLLKRLNGIGKGVLLTHGNHESGNLRGLWKKYKRIKYVHMQGFKIKNYLFLFYGGLGFSARDEFFDRKCKDYFMKLVKKFRKEEENAKIIFVTHQPPAEFKVGKVGKEDCGNKSFTEFIKEAKPELVLCGHLHENFGVREKTNNGKTLILNPGPRGEIVEV